MKNKTTMTAAMTSPTISTAAELSPVPGVLTMVAIGNVRMNKAVES